MRGSFVITAVVNTVSMLLLFLLPSAASAFSLGIGTNGGQTTKPPAFVQQVVVPWHRRSRTLFRDHFTCPPLRELSPLFEQAAQRYETELGIPKLFFQEWVSWMFENDDEDGDLYHKTYEMIADWGSNQNVCIEGGNFDWEPIYCRLVQQEIREEKESILNLFESSESLTFPSELAAIPRDKLLSSHDYDELLQNSIAAVVEEGLLSPQDSWFLNPFNVCAGDTFFISMNEIRLNYYFPPDMWRTHPLSKDLDNIFYFQGLFASTNTYSAVQLHLVKHIEAWRLNLDSLPKLYNEIAVPLLERDCDHKFLTEGPWR